jgi:CheY-like chemotaxis protein
MKRRILLVDDDLAVLLTLKAVLELHEFEIDTASTTAEAFARMESSTYQMVISDLRMETEDAGLEVIRTAHRQHYAPATALLTAYPPPEEYWCGKTPSGEYRTGDRPDSLLVKPVGTSDLLRQLDALLIRHAGRQQLRQTSPQTQPRTRPAG